MSEISYKIDESVNEIFDEKGNTFLAMRKVSWNDRDHKIELRRWRNDKDGNEFPDKGFTFLTEEGPNELVNVLIKHNYGRTKDIINGIKDRNDFIDSINYVLGDKEKYETSSTETEDDQFYDPSKCLFE